MAQGSNHNTGSKQLVILLIENDPAAAFLTKEALKEAGLHESVTSVRDGEEALALLRSLEKQDDLARPDVIFLDLHLPRESGLEVLEEIKGNRTWAATPVIVVSGSSNPQEVRRAYELHASCFIRKPDELDELLRFMRVCYEFWGSVVTLPEQAATRG
ncbi:MAG TPA: response regulator [Bryobacteraceae bacterium]|jgi:chemotaxis family two-component system response regulator Rcp1|nr:response regulator [Bryobacteraceae bacterium]